MASVKNISGGVNILTFDIEDWFHTHQNRNQYSGHIWSELPSKVEENTERILRVLEENELKATFFVLGWVAKYFPHLIKKIHSQGHEIGSHSYWHHNPHFISHDNFEKDLKLSIDVIQDITGEKVTAYRAPGFNLNLKDKWAFEILSAYGITIDSSIQLYNSSREIPLTIHVKGNRIIEFPLITSTFGFPYSGGGYFRALPFFIVNYLLKQSPYQLLYFHPRDFDADNPMTNLFSFFRNSLNRYNTGKNRSRLEYVLKQYKTCTLWEAAKLTKPD